MYLEPCRAKYVAKTNLTARQHPAKQTHKMAKDNTGPLRVVAPFKQLRKPSQAETGTEAAVYKLAVFDSPIHRKFLEEFVISNMARTIVRGCGGGGGYTRTRTHTLACTDNNCVFVLCKQACTSESIRQRLAL